MFKTIGFLLALVLVLVGGLGWCLGSVYPAPPNLIVLLHPDAMQRRAAEALNTVEWGDLRERLSSET